MPRTVNTATARTTRKAATLAARVIDTVDQRDAAIRAMSLEGASLRAISDATGLTHTVISRILGRR